jgi:hypothetical protein
MATAITTKKQEFIDRVSGKPVPHDMFGNVISLGDYIVWGAGSQSSSALNFGRVVKINYNKEKYSKKAGDIVSSVSVVKMAKSTAWDQRSNPNKVVNGFVKGRKKVACSSYQNAMVLDGPPNKTAEQILGDIEIPKA